MPQPFVSDKLRNLEHCEAALMRTRMEHDNMRLACVRRAVSGGTNLLEEVLEVTEQQSQTFLIQRRVSQHGSNADWKRSEE